MPKLKLDELTDQQQDQEQVTSLNDEMRLMVIGNLLDMQNNARVNSRINKQQVNSISKLFMFSKTFNNSFARDLATEILHLQVSIQGYGRKELVQILQTSNMLEPNIEQVKQVKEVFR